MHEKPPVSNKMSVLVNPRDFKLLVSTKKVLSVKLERVDADEKFPGSNCSCMPNRTARDCVLCEICGYLFVNEFIFKKHLVHPSFHHLQPFKCERCDRLFQTEHLLKRHQVNFKIHAGWRCMQFQCRVCSSRFSRMKFFKNHLKLNRKCMLNCTVCGQDFLKKKKLTSLITGNHINPTIKPDVDYSVVQEFGILLGNTFTCSSHQKSSRRSHIGRFGEEISIIKIEPLVTTRKRTKNNAACQTESSISPTMEPPEPFFQNPLDLLDLENVNLTEYCGSDDDQNVNHTENYGSGDHQNVKLVENFGSDDHQNVNFTEYCGSEDHRNVNLMENCGSEDHQNVNLMENCGSEDHQNVNLMENCGSEDHQRMDITSQTTTETISSGLSQCHHAAIPQLTAENHSFQMKETHNPFSKDSSGVVTNDFLHSQHQQAALLEFLARKDTSKSQDALTVSADSQIKQYSSQQSVFPYSLSGLNQSLVQKSHRVLSDLLKTPSLIITSSPPAQNQTQQFSFQQVNIESGSLPLKESPQSVSSMEGDQGMQCVQIPEDQTASQMCTEKQCVLPPTHVNQQFHNMFENHSARADGQIYSLMKTTSQSNLPSEREDQSEYDSSLLIASMLSNSQIEIQNTVCNITPCLVCKKKFIYNPESDQHIVNIFQCTKCKRIFSQEKEVLKHQCDIMDVPILSYSIKTKNIVQPNELAIVSGATGKSEELQKHFTSELAIAAQHSVQDFQLSKDAAGVCVSDQCCESCRSIIVNVPKPNTQPMVYLIDDLSQLQMIQNMSGNAISLPFKSGSSFAAGDLQSWLKTTIDSSHRDNTMHQVPECLQQKTLDSSHERDSIIDIVACLKQKVIEKIRKHISSLVDQSYKENSSVQSEQFPADGTKCSDWVRVNQDMCVWNDTPIEIASDGNKTFLVGMTCNIIDKSVTQGEDNFQENENAQIISTNQIKQEVIDPSNEQRSMGGHAGTSISDQVSEIGEGLVNQMEEAAERPIWTNPVKMIKQEEFDPSDEQRLRGEHAGTSISDQYSEMDEGPVNQMEEAAERPIWTNPIKMIKQEEFDPTDAQRFRGGHGGTSISDQYSEMDEGLVNQMEEAAERPIWTNPIKMIKQEEFDPSDEQRLRGEHAGTSISDQYSEMDEGLINQMEEAAERPIWTNPIKMIKREEFDQSDEQRLRGEHAGTSISDQVSEIFDQSDAQRFRGEHAGTSISDQVSEIGEGLVNQMEEAAERPIWTNPIKMIKQEEFDQSDAQRFRGEHAGTSISDQVNEVGEGFTNQMEEAAERLIWIKPLELIKGEEFVITDSKKQIETSEERQTKIDSQDSMETLEKPKSINLLGGMDGICQAQIVWTGSVGQLKIFSQNCNKVEMDSDTIKDIDFHYIESPEMEICTADDELIIESDFVENSSVLPEGFVYVENL